MKHVDVRSVGGLLLSVLLVGCLPSAEQKLLNQFFAASRLRDKTALANVATVVFEPREQGTVAEFEITGVRAVQGAGNSTVKEVTLSALVRQPDGQTVRQTLIVTISMSMVTAVRSAASP